MKIKDKWFYFPILVLGLYFIYRLINQSQMLFQFPLELTNDYGAHIGQLYFFAKYGFHQIIPDWYNGFKLFLFYPPGWYFFALPIYLITKNILFTTFISVILMFLIIFIALMIFGRTQGFSIAKRIVFFLFLFANSIAIGNYIRLGRVSELFALTCLVVLATITLYFRNKKLNWKFFVIFILFYFLIIIAHPSTAILFHVLLLSLFIIKSLKEKLMLILASVTSVTLSSFWWLPFIMNLTPELNRVNFSVARRILHFSGAMALTSYVTFLVIGILGFTFFIYWKGRKYSRKELIFFMPILITGLLFVTRIVVFIPLLNKVYPDVYMIFFLFFSIYFLLSTKIKSSILKNLIIIGLIILPLLSVAVSEVHTPKFMEYTSLEHDTLEILPFVNGSFIFPVLYKPTSHPPMYYSYGAVYYNLSTPAGAIPFGASTSDYFMKIRSSEEYLKNKDCFNFIEIMVFINATDIITYNEHCNTLKECGLEEVKIKNEVCLFLI